MGFSFSPYFGPGASAGYESSKMPPMAIRTPPYSNVGLIVILVNAIELFEDLLRGSCGGGSMFQRLPIAMKEGLAGCTTSTPKVASCCAGAARGTNPNKNKAAVVTRFDRIIGLPPTNGWPLLGPLGNRLHAPVADAFAASSPFNFMISKVISADAYMSFTSSHSFTV